MPNFNDEYKKIRRRLAENKISKDLADYEAAKLNAWSAKLRSQWRAPSPEVNVTSLIVAEDYKQLVENHEIGVLRDNDFLRECAKLLALCEAAKMSFPGPRTLVDDININFVSGALLNEFAGDEFEAGQPQDPNPQGVPTGGGEYGGLDDADEFDDEYDELDDDDEFDDEGNNEPQLYGSHQAGGVTFEVWSIGSDDQEFIVKDAQGNQYDPDVNKELFLQYYKAMGYPEITEEQIIAQLQRHAEHYRNQPYGSSYYEPLLADQAKLQDYVNAKRWDEMIMLAVDEFN